jgi:membrane-bound lytic murein transglycosylase A
MLSLSIRRSVPPLLALVALLAACTTQQPQPQPQPQPKPPVTMPPPVGPIVVPPAQPGEPAQPAAPLFTPTTYDALPGWRQDDLREAWPAFQATCRALGSKPEWKAPCAGAAPIDARDGDAIRAYFETYFEPNVVRAADGADTGLVTGYYEPLLRGSRRHTGPFQTPLYKVPDDLITVDLASVYPTLKGMRLRGRLVGKTVVPYSTRAEIERAAIPGKELLWVDDPVDAFFLEVQGSGRVQLDDGDTVRVAYADQNGHPYKTIGRWLIDQGELRADQASAQGIKAWIAAHPARRQELLNVNPSYVFFKEERLVDPNVGPKGALGVPLTPTGQRRAAAAAGDGARYRRRDQGGGARRLLLRLRRPGARRRRAHEAARPAVGAAAARGVRQFGYPVTCGIKRSTGRRRRPARRRRYKTS